MKLLLSAILACALLPMAHSQPSIYEQQLLSLDEGVLKFTGPYLGTLYVEDEGLRSLVSTTLVSITYLAVYENPLLTNVDLRALQAHIGGSGGQSLYISGNPSLIAINLGALTTSGNAIYLSNNSNLTTLNLSKLAFVSQYIGIENDVSLSSLSLPALAGSAYSGFFAGGCSSLSMVSFPKYLPKNGRPQLFNGCALTQASVDHVLSRCVANTGYTSGTVDLSGGTSAPPSATGLADKATLIARGCTVLTN